MNDEQRFFLSVFRQPPARLTVEQVGWVLNCASHNIRILVRAGLLKPLGDPPENGEKVFHTDEILELIKNKSWLARVTNAIHRAHHVKNETRKSVKQNRVTC